MFVKANEVFFIDFLAKQPLDVIEPPMVVVDSSHLEFREFCETYGWVWFVFKCNKKGEYGISILGEDKVDHYVIECEEN